MPLDGQTCPVCGRGVSPDPRYPRYLCDDCAARATAPDGRPLTFSNVALSGGYAAAFTDSGEDYFDHDCVVDGIVCHADEARFGGIVVQALA